MSNKIHSLLLRKTFPRNILKFKLHLLISVIIVTAIIILTYHLPMIELVRHVSQRQPGYMGRPVIIDKDNLTETELLQYENGWKQNAFNQFVSDIIALDRPLADIRDSSCKQLQYNRNELLPKTSVIMCFHNEAWSALLRSVHSILRRSPRELLHEIILVDDYSDLDHLKKPLDDYIAKLNIIHEAQRTYSLEQQRQQQQQQSGTNKTDKFIKIVRNKQREGLIRARLAGADVASGEVLTFLDSHIECTHGWLEPLLNRIYEDAWTVVCPVIDVINENTFEYPQNSNLDQISVGGFEWNLQFNWHVLSEKEKAWRKVPTDPIRSPTMAGGLFSINRHFFNKLGRYDDGFEIWGGENLELSFKTWMCGGKLEIVPCSHVGHIFRSRSPYQWKSGVNVLKKNSVRLAEVWMDEYKTFYYERIGFDLGDYGNISKRIELRKQLQCKPFSYYVREVYPDLFIPSHTLARGYIYNEQQLVTDRELCLDGVTRKDETVSLIKPLNCHHLGGNQYWLLTKNNEIKRDDYCFDYDTRQLTLFRCHNSGGNQLWLYSHEVSLSAD